MGHQKVEIKKMDELRDEYMQKTDFLSDMFESVNAYQFYRDIFPEGFLQDAYKVDENARKNGKYTAIANVLIRRKRDGEFYRRNFHLTNDLSQLSKWAGSEAFLAPCSFVGGKKDLEHLRFVHAFVVDLDDVGMDQLHDLFHEITVGLLPRPTFIVNSGTGLHLYYVLAEPYHVYRDRLQGLAAVKHSLIEHCWNPYTSRLQEDGDKQYSGLVQPYRIPGTRTKLDKDKDGRIVMQQYPVLAFRVGDKWTLDQLLDFKPCVPSKYPDNMAKAAELLKLGRTPLVEAKEKWPEWYDRRIVHLEPLKQAGKDYRWNLSSNVYNWWLKRVGTEVQKSGHRYHCILCLAIYAVKCNIPFEQLQKDAYRLIPVLDQYTDREDNHFLKSEVDKALLVYKQKSYVTFPLNSIEHLSGLTIERNKRNGRKQEVHLAGARAIQKINDEFNGTNWREGNGRPKGSGTKRELVCQYIDEHPDATQREIAKALGISKTTVNKWAAEYDQWLVDQAAEENEGGVKHEND